MGWQAVIAAATSIFNLGTQLLKQYGSGDLTEEQVLAAFKSMADGYNQAVSDWDNAPGP